MLNRAFLAAKLSSFLSASVRARCARAPLAERCDPMRRRSTFLAKAAAEAKLSPIFANRTQTDWVRPICCCRLGAVFCSSARKANERSRARVTGRTSPIGIASTRASAAPGSRAVRNCDASSFVVFPRAEFRAATARPSCCFRPEDEQQLQLAAGQWDRLPRHHKSSERAPVIRPSGRTLENSARTDK